MLENIKYGATTFYDFSEHRNLLSRTCQTPSSDLRLAIAISRYPLKQVTARPIMAQALVVDPHPIVLKAVKEMLQMAFPYIRIKGSSGDEVLEEICGDHWAFVVMDIHLAGQNGIEIIKKAKASFPETPIIVFGTYSERQYAAHALGAGAIAYLSKDRSPRDLIDTVRMTLGGGQAHKPREGAGSKSSLSHREGQVLRLFANGLNRREIAKRLGIKERTVSTYKTKLFEKLDLQNFAELIRYAIEEGIN